MDVAISVVKDVIKWRMGKKIISVYNISPYGKDMKSNSHLYCLLTEGEFKRNGTWVDGYRILPL